MNGNIRRESIKSWGALILLSLVWGTSYILIKKSITVFTPYQVGCLRISISALAFLPVLVLQWRKVNWKKWPYLLLVGMTGTAIPSFLFPIAQTQVSSSIAGILNSLTPLSTLILGVIFFRSTLIKEKLLGVIIGLLGAIILIIFGNTSDYQANIWYSLIIVLATICYATSSNTVGYYLKDMNAVLISTVSFFMVGVPGMLLLFQTDFIPIMQTNPEAWQVLSYVSYLAILSTVLASILFFQLIKWTNPVFASLVSYLVPLVAVFWGIFDGESLTVYHLAGMILIFLGVYLSRK